MTNNEKMRAALAGIVDAGTRTIVIRVGDMYAANGYDTFTEISDEAALAFDCLEELHDEQFFEPSTAWQNTTNGYTHYSAGGPKYLQCNGWFSTKENAK